MNNAAMIEERRRQRAQQFGGDLNSAADMILDGVAGYGVAVEGNAKKARDAEDRTAKQGADKATAVRLAAAEARAVAGEGRAVVDHDAAVLRRKQADADATADRAAATAKTESERVLREKKAKGDAAESKAAAGMQRGLSRAELEAQAAEAGITAEELLLRTDNAESERRVKSTDSVLRQKKLETGAALDEARTTAALRPKAGKAPDPDADLKHRKLAAETAAAEAALTKKTDDATNGTPLSSTEREGVVELQNALKMLDATASMKTGADGGAPIDTGPIAALEAFLRPKFTVGDPRVVEFKSTVGSQLVEYIKSISGGAVSDEERKELISLVPTIEDDDEEFMAGLAAVRRRLEMKLKTKKDAYTAGGQDTRVFNASGGAAPPASTQSAKVVVKAKNGKVLRIDRSKLAAALAAGAVEVTQ